MAELEVLRNVNRFTLLLEDGESIEPKSGEFVATARLPHSVYNEGILEFECLNCQNSLSIDIYNAKLKSILTIDDLKDGEFVRILGLKAKLNLVLTDSGEVYGFKNYLKNHYSLYINVIFYSCENCERFYAILYNRVGDTGRILDETAVYSIFEINADDKMIANLIIRNRSHLASDFYS